MVMSMGRDWNSLEELQQEQAAFSKLVHALAGLYFWEVAVSWEFEWAFLVGKKKFHWPMIFYFLGRYFQLFCIIGLLIVVNNTSGNLNCQAIFTFAQLTGQAVIGFASLNLAIRAMVVWYWKRYIVIPLILIILGHWALLMQGVKIQVNSTPQGCAVVDSHSITLPVTFAYTMSLDLCVLLLTTYQLVIVRGRRTQLMNLLFTDGLVYFGFAFLVNLPATIFMFLNLNPFMSVLFGFPTTVVSTVIACRAVRRLSDFATGGIQVSIGQRFTLSTAGFTGKPSGAISKQASGVHVQVDTFSTGDIMTEHKVGSTDPEQGSSVYNPR
ncbi:hypothetical protein QCA50_006347 [Cerrena zonata]|uniref:Uncharacterized protein n=1 Tax=Cerrena zonata TaxID=2478898 RepID=A0AAW0G7T7_9APHY